MSESIQVTLPDGTKKPAPKGMTIADFVRENIGAGLAKAAVIAKLDGTQVDLSRQLDHDVKLEVV
ncbi:MAG TPA: TGS domain-containing protein, partial [Myxococcaceae bacterium]|nr:TGS domain-containing protein [Myxococcaceae bacterium]